MPKISLKFSKNSNRHYTIHLGNMQWLEFKSERYIKKYLAKYRKIVTANVQILNQYNLMFLSSYNQHYFELSHLEIYKINDIITDYNERYLKVFDNYSDGNQNAFVFQNLFSSISLLSASVDILFIHGTKHKNYALKNATVSLRKMIYDLEININKDMLDLQIFSKPYFTELRVIPNAIESKSNA